MKTSSIVLTLFLILFFTATVSAGQQGEEIFKSNGCIFCHKQRDASGSFPSLSEVGKAYKGKKEQLVRYLKGEAQPIIEPERAGIMKRQLEKTKAMSDSERSALADFMLSH